MTIVPCRRRAIIAARVSAEQVEEPVAQAPAPKPAKPKAKRK